MECGDGDGGRVGDVGGQGGKGNKHKTEPNERPGIYLYLYTL